MASPDALQTPTLDAEAPELIQRVTEEGGYAFSTMAALAAGGDLRAAEAAREMAWEQLHSGPWSSVLPVWRDAYSMACLHVAKAQYARGELKEAFRVLDMGLIMGGTLLRKDLDAALHRLSAETANADTVAAKGKDEEEGAQKSASGRKANEVDEAEVLRALPRKSLSCSPVIISDSMAHWPARKKWGDMEYLKRVAGERTVPVEVGKNYLCSDWKQELITFSEFLRRIQSFDGTSDDPTYLAQHPLFDQISDLRKDILIPDYCFAGGGELRSLNAWFGPAGTVTPLHHDPHHNILAQVVGRKYVRLYPASISEELYPYSETMLHNSSKVDLDNIDETQFPKVQELEFLDCILEEGDMLYIPPRWWHYVRALTVSYSVSFWWSDCGSSCPS
uniref:JmjC domain-containing protein n=1 Tax=Kalanchoe fedtschenkoi TaxID=63787 RepID=A0A7N0V8L9_KALFE